MVEGLCDIEWRKQVIDDALLDPVANHLRRLLGVEPVASDQ
jgi:hypothetical protein